MAHPIRSAASRAIVTMPRFDMEQFLEMLEKYQVTLVLFIGGTKKVHETNIVERCGRSKTCNVPAQLAGFAIGMYHHRSSIPADYRANTMFDCLVTRDRALLGQRDGIRSGPARNAASTRDGGRMKGRFHPVLPGETLLTGLH